VGGGRDAETSRERPVPRTTKVGGADTVFVAASSHGLVNLSPLRAPAGQRLADIAA